jgi:methionyl-tRNA formyltransferase
MRIDAGLDTGDMLMWREIAIQPEDTAITLAPKLAALTAELLVETLPALKGGRIRPQAQDNSQATLAPILKKEDGLIDWQRSATTIWNRLRGFQPWPGAHTTYRGKTLNVIAAAPVTMELSTAGELRIDSGSLLVGCSEGSALKLIEVQPEGKKKMAARDFLNGYRPQSGERLGQ